MPIMADWNKHPTEWINLLRPYDLRPTMTGKA